MALLYNWLIYGAMVVCVAGVGYRVWTWFRWDPAHRKEGMAPFHGMREAVTESMRVLFSRRILPLIWAFVRDVLFLSKLFELGWHRWAAHFAIVTGFMVLLVMHALDDLIMVKLFRGYESTLNPYLFIRNFAGVLVAAGLVGAAWRRIRNRCRALRVFTDRADVVLLGFLGFVVLSGFLLEASKITSKNDFDRMVAEWAFVDDPIELRALETYWISELGLAPARGQPGPDAQTLALGGEIHEMNCIGCHDHPGWAFAGYSVSRILRPAGALLDRAGIPAILWWVHVLSALAGLAMLPFTKMFHVIATPVSLLANAVANRERMPASLNSALQMIELDACTHCGTCTQVCSVGICHEALSNVHILPSEKIRALASLARGERFSSRRTKRLQAGLYICTNCTRCTGICPSGIDLQGLWQDSRDVLLREGTPGFMLFSPLSFFPALRPEEGYRESLKSSTRALLSNWHDAAKADPLTPWDATSGGLRRDLGLTLEGRNFSLCYRCRTCTNACPVVGAYERPMEMLGLVPHQIMHAVSLGLKDLSLNCKMLWYCLGCYQCQEHCPQGVRVTDVFYELKNIAMKSNPPGGGKRSLNGLRQRVNLT